MIKFWRTLFREGKYAQIVEDAPQRTLAKLTIADFNYLGLAALASKSIEWFDSLRNSDSLPPKFLPYFKLYDGAVSYQNKFYNEASSLILSAKSIVTENGYIFDGDGCSWLRGVNSYVHQLDHHITPSIEAPELDLQSLEDEILGAPICFLASADSGYFSKFGGGLINSFIQNRDTEAILVIGIINPCSEAKQWVSQNSIALAKSGVHFIYTNGPEDKTYYACNRFLLAPVLMDIVNTGIYSLDIDAVFVAKTSVFDNTILKYDGAFQQQEHRLPWQKCQAGRIYFSNSPAGREMIHTVSNYCRVVFQNDLDQWFLDQNALEYYRRQQEVIQSANIVNLHELPLVRNAVFCPPGSKKKQLESSLF
ncbi:hypothetical protein ACF8ED_11580 [Pseudomonas sp. zbq_17]